MVVQYHTAECSGCHIVKGVRYRGLCDRCYMTGSCLHCKKLVMLKSRKLCYSCWHNVSIRIQYPVRSKFVSKAVADPSYDEAGECERAEQLAIVMRRLSDNPMTVDRLAEDLLIPLGEMQVLVDDIVSRELATIDPRTSRIRIVDWWSREFNMSIFKGKLV